MKLYDLVTRISYNHDIVFQIILIKDNIYYLKGVDYRLGATAFENDLLPYEETLFIT